ncbi:MAG: hypothetical protein AAGJ70_09110 [Pseudomonadota bacterium]
MSRIATRLLHAGVLGTGVGFLIISAFAVLVVTANSAKAQSLKDDFVLVETPRYAWHGCYFGIAGGASLEETRALQSPQIDAIGNTARNGFTAGGYAGCMMQSGPLVFGVEGDLSLASNGPDYFGSIRGRLGTTIDASTLLYGTYGYAFADQDYTVTFAGNTSSISERVDGYVWGGGIERSVAPNGAFRLEVLQYVYGPSRFGPGAAQDVRVRQSHTVIRAGMTIALGNFFGAGTGSGVDDDVIQ